MLHACLIPSLGVLEQRTNLEVTIDSRQFSMTQLHPSHSSLLQEASSVDTSAERLQELFRVDSSLGPVIALNPSASIQLLDQLALHYPAEVLANSLLLIRTLEAGGAYRDFSLGALISLSLACDLPPDASLLAETWRRIKAGLEELQGQEYASLECDWLYSRNFTLLPEDCGGVIEKPLEFALEVRANMYANGAVSIYGIPCLDNVDSGTSKSQRSLLAEFFRAVATGEIRDYINEDDLTREDGGSADVDLKVAELPAGLSLDGMYLCRDDEYILEVYYDFSGGDSPIVCDNGIVTVPVEFWDEVNHRYQIAIGELSDVVGLESKCPVLSSDWHERLAVLLIP